MSQEKKEISVLHTLSGLHVAGVGRMLLRNVVALESRGVRNHVVFMVPNRLLEPQYREQGVEPICVDHRRIWQGPRSVRRLMRVIRGFDVDIVHTNHPLDRLYAGLAGRLSGIPVVTTAHDTNPDVSRSRHRGGRARVWLERALHTKYIAVSDAVARVYETRRGVPPEQMRLIYSGIDLARFEVPPDQDELADLRRKLDLNGARPVLINVARLHPMKAQGYLVDMMTDLLGKWPHAHLLLVGEGESRPELERAIRQAGLDRSVQLLGIRSDVRELLALADVFLFPSTEKEGLPVAVMEAMAAAKPVVAAAVGPLAEMVEDGETGMLVEPHSPAALAAAVDRLASSAEMLQSMGRRANRLARERFSVDQTARRMELFYREVLSGAPV